MYHLYKKSRIYNGHPYSGNGIPAQYETLEEARNAQAELTARNPVGWDIYDGKTWQLIDDRKKTKE